MSLGTTPFLTEFRQGGTPVGIQVNGVLYVTGAMVVPIIGGLIMQDQNTGAFYRLSITTVDGVGVVGTDPVTFP